MRGWTMARLHVYGTPRRLAVLVHDLAPRQRLARAQSSKARRPKSRSMPRARRPKPPKDLRAAKVWRWPSLQVQDLEGGEYVVAIKREEGQATPGGVWRSCCPSLIAALKFDKTMRWNSTNVAFSRPIRWLVALLGERGDSIRVCRRGEWPRHARRARRWLARALTMPKRDDYLDTLREQSHHRWTWTSAAPSSRTQIDQLAESVGGEIVPTDPGLLDEVTNLVEQPTALLGNFEPEYYLDLPRDVLVTVMRKHQRYFPRANRIGRQLLPYFVAVRNGGKRHLEHGDARQRRSLARALCRCRVLFPARHVQEAWTTFCRAWAR